MKNDHEAILNYLAKQITTMQKFHAEQCKKFKESNDIVAKSYHAGAEFSMLLIANKLSDKIAEVETKC